MNILLIIKILSVGLFLLLLFFYRKYNVSYKYSIGGLLMLLILLVDKGENILSSLLFDIICIFITYIPVHKHTILRDRTISEHYRDIIIGEKSCRRIDYWFMLFLLVSIFVIILLGIAILSILLRYDISYTDKGFYYILLVIFLINLFFESKRLEDANLSRYFLLIHLFAILGTPFIVITSILMLILLCMPTQSNINEHNDREV